MIRFDAYPWGRAGDARVGAIITSNWLASQTFINISLDITAHSSDQTTDLFLEAFAVLSRFVDTLPQLSHGLGPSCVK